MTEPTEAVTATRTGDITRTQPEGHSITIDLKDWQDEMEKRGMLDCQFRCPACGNAASPNDWKKLGPDLAPDRAVVECIGRAAPKLMAGGEFEPGPAGGCDWAAFGLFDICKVHVKFDDGHAAAVFDFAVDPLNPDA